MKKGAPYLLVAFAVICVTEKIRAEEPQAHAAEIEAIVKEFCPGKRPGMAVLVSRDGIPLHLAGYGLADIKAGTPITTDSLFDLASVSKHITAVAILTLVEQGKLFLNEPVSKYLKDFEVPVKGRPVLISDLLHHTSGLADYTGEEWDGSEEEFATLTPETHLEWLNTTKPRRSPGKKYEYNNSEYVLLSLLIERISEQSYAEYVGEHLFVPAGIKNTMILDGTRKLPSSAVKGYAIENGKMNRSSLPTVNTGDGNVYSSIRDLAKWDLALRSQKVISENSLNQAWTNGRLDSGEPIRDEDGDGYGFGWVIEGKNIVCHDGSWSGTATYYQMNRKTGLTIVILSNDENAEVASVAGKISELFDPE